MINRVAYDVDQIAPKTGPSLRCQADSVRVDFDVQLSFAQPGGQGRSVAAQPAQRQFRGFQPPRCQAIQDATGWNSSQDVLFQLFDLFGTELENVSALVSQKRPQTLVENTPALVKGQQGFRREQLSPLGQLVFGLLAQLGNDAETYQARIAFQGV